MSISVYVKLDWAVEVQVRNEFFRGVTELLGSLTKNPMLMPMPPRGGAEIFPQGRCIMMHCRCCGWWGCCPYHNCCSPHIWQRINFKKPEVNIKKSPLDRLLHPVSLAGDMLVRIPNNDIIWSKSMKFHILEILAICENNRDYCHTFRTFGFAALRVLWFVGQFKRLTLNSSTETPIVRLRLRSSSSTCGKSLRSGFE